MDMELHIKKLDADTVKEFAKKAWELTEAKAAGFKESETVKCLVRKTGAYIHRMEIRDLTLVKLASLTAGFMAGLCAPKKWKKPLMVLAGAVFVLTFIPSMVKFVRGLLVEE